MLERGEPGGHLIPQLRRIGFAVCVVMVAYLGRDREAGRDRKPQIAHFGETGALAAEQVFHIGAALGGAVAKTVDPLRHPPLTPRFAKNRRPGSGWPGCATTSAAGFP